MQFALLHSLFSLLKWHFFSYLMDVFKLKFLLRKCVVWMIAKNEPLLQHLGTPALAIFSSVWEVMRLISFHSSFDKGVAFNIKLKNMPVPMAAPQLP